MCLTIQHRGIIMKPERQIRGCFNMETKTNSKSVKALERQSGAPVKANERGAGRKKDDAMMLLKRLAFYDLHISGWKRNDIIEALGISPRTFTKYKSYLTSNIDYFQEIGIPGRQWRKGTDGFAVEADAARRLIEIKTKVPVISEADRRELIKKIGSLEKLSAISEGEAFRSFDTGIYAEAVKGYLAKAIDDLKESGSDEEKMAAALIGRKLEKKLSDLMKEVSSKHMQNYYRKRKEA